jgi:hypothetical protein
MGNSSNALMQLQVARILKNFQKNSSRKKTNNKSKKTPFFNKGLRRVFFDSNGFYIVIPSKNNKTGKKQYVSGTFAFKNTGFRIIPLRAIR